MRLTPAEANWVKHVLLAEAAALADQPLPRVATTRRQQRQRQVRVYEALAAALERREVVEYELE